MQVRKAATQLTKIYFTFAFPPSHIIPLTTLSYSLGWVILIDTSETKRVHQVEHNFFKKAELFAPLYYPKAQTHVVQR